MWELREGSALEVYNTQLTEALPETVHKGMTGLQI